MNDSQKSNVAVFGLGLIGSIWARHLNDAGILAASWNRTHKPAFPQSVLSAAEAAKKSGVLIIVVTNPAAVESVIDDILPVLTTRHLVIQSSTIGGADSARLSQKVREAGARYLEAPFTGSKPAAEARKTVFYLGGDKQTVTEADPVLSVFSAMRIHCGTGEQACAIKLAMNLQAVCQAEALSEALFSARAAGVSDDVFFECMRGNVSWSGLSALKEPKLRERNYETQFSVKHMLKDMKLMKSNNDNLPALDLMIAQLEKAVEAGRQDDDFISLYKNLN